MLYGDVDDADVVKFTSNRKLTLLKYEYYHASALPVEAADQD
jgi:hypothetical protein